MDEPDVRVGVPPSKRDRGLVDVRGQIFCRSEQPQKSLLAPARGGFPSPMPRGDLFIPGVLVQAPNRLLDLVVSDDQEPPPLHISAAGSTYARFQDLSNHLIWHRVRLQPAIDRVVLMISNRSLPLVCSGMA